jgi:hypothetical protein
VRRYEHPREDTVLKTKEDEWKEDKEKVGEEEEEEEEEEEGGGTEGVK